MTFPAYIRRIYVLTFRMVSGFEWVCPLAQRDRLYPLAVRRPQFAHSFLQIPPTMDTLAVRLASHHQGLQDSTPSPRSGHHSHLACAYALRAMPGAQTQFKFAYLGVGEIRENMACNVAPDKCQKARKILRSICLIMGVPKTARGAYESS